MKQPTVISIACNVRLVASVPKPGLPNGGPRKLKPCKTIKSVINEL